MATNMQRLESRVEALISLLERTGNSNAPPGGSKEETKGNFSVTSV